MDEKRNKTTIVIPVQSPVESKKIRIAAYCRVSTQAEEQNNSLMAQIDYYTKLYADDEKYELVGVYADRGTSGTRTRNREEFLKLIEDCRARKIDAVITKSVSRFGRNTVDTLMFTRELKELGIDVFFEKENLHTYTAEGELLLTLIAAVAESEAVSLSDNVKWGKRHRYKKGIVESLTLGIMLGFTQQDGSIGIVEEEANTVRMIYDLFMLGHGYQYISSFLKTNGIPTKYPGSTWENTTVFKILHNEKYCGDCLFQKTYISDPIKHKSSPNRGELPQYFVEDVLPAIIPKDMWLAAQELQKRHAGKGHQHKESLPFSHMLICPFCGNTYVNYVSATHNKELVSWFRCKSYKLHTAVLVPGVMYTPPSRERIADPTPELIAYREKYNRPTPPRPMICSDIRIPREQPKKAFVQAWNLIVGKKTRYQASLQRTVITTENPLTRYRAKEMISLLDTVGRIKEFDFQLMLRTLDFVEVSPPDKLSFVFQCGIRITV